MIATAPWLFLAASLIGLGFTLSALIPARRLSFFSLPYFMGAWITGELPLHHIGWQAVALLGFLALGALRAWPGILALAITFTSWAVLVALHHRGRRGREALERALREGLGDGFRDQIPHPIAVQQRERIPPALLARPFRTREAKVEVIRGMAYGDAGKRHTFDVYRPADGRQLCPTLLQIHGGAWVYGQKDQQGLPLMNYLAARGWICFAPNYRLSPRATFPEQLIDVKQMLAWIRERGAELGADPDFVAVTGGSAGGHLAALTALTPNVVAYQPGFETVDTSVNACVPLYGVYDFLDRNGVRGSQAMTPFLERMVMKCSPVTHRERWDQASPIACISPDAPPFFVIHGTHDSLAYVEDARHFVAALRAVSRASVLYAEIPGAQHAFDIFHSPRCAEAVHAIAWFLEHVRAVPGRDERRQRCASW